MTIGTRDAVRDVRRIRRIRRTARAAGIRGDVWCCALAIALVLVAAAVGYVLNHRPRPDIFADAAPLFGSWLPHVGIGTPFAIVLAIAVITRGDALFARPRWRLALAYGYLASVGWTWSLAMIDGWQRGLADRLSTPDEYLPTVRNVSNIAEFIRNFSQHIVGNSQYSVHIAGDPPGGTLIFVLLDRLGFSGGGPASIACVLIGGLAPISVAITVRALGAEAAARAILPFAVLFPGAVWIGVSADGLFAGIAASAIAIFAIGAVSRNWLVAYGCQFLGGALLGFSAMCSYGIVLLAPVAIAVALIAKNGRAIVIGALGAAGVFGIFGIAGFWWFDGYFAVRQRYYDGIGGQRPYAYWVWANLAGMVVSTGPFVLAGLRRAVATGRRMITDPDALLPVAAALAIAIADISGLSKAETERIWLPFTVWLIASVALLPGGGRKWWLAAQASTALVVNHLILTGW